MISGSTFPELTDRLRQVLQVLRNTGLHAKKEKCLFGVTSVDFLGYRIDASGIHPSRSKMEAIQNAPVPQNRQELQAFLGLLNFYNCFLKGKGPLQNRCIVSSTKARRGFGRNVMTKALQQLSELLTSKSVLAPFKRKWDRINNCFCFTNTDADGTELYPNRSGGFGFNFRS
ncbi:hypothetical protein M514_23884 [Trichuris suis]|uniref:Reverse transcriptase domain-containing protein n=1 Tax=Trichuris suis TaxID=68888 RepID=A0A085N347_9BILA|nr:hypothetical protein M514_23884 [Trichuris suis]